MNTRTATRGRPTGPAVKGSGALLAGDPHLPQTLPSVWYEVALSAPGLDVDRGQRAGLARDPHRT